MKKLDLALIVGALTLLFICLVFINAVWNSGYKAGLRHATEMSQENK